MHGTWLMLEEPTVQIKTDSEVGNNELLDVQFHQNGGLNLGRVKIIFSSPPKYMLTNCMDSFSEFNSSLPSDRAKVCLRWNRKFET